MNISTIALVMATALLAGLGFAADGKETDQAAGKTHDMTVQLVSVDNQSKTITVKDDKGGTKAVPVLGNAARNLRNLRTGEMYTLTCQDNEKGEHQGISAIKAAKPAAK